MSGSKTWALFEESSGNITGKNLGRTGIVKTPKNYQKYLKKLLSFSNCQVKFKKKCDCSFISHGMSIRNAEIGKPEIIAWIVGEIRVEIIDRQCECKFI